jgi:hypothetical protein
MLGLQMVPSRLRASLADAPARRIPGESPPDPLQDARRHAHARWLTGAPFLTSALDDSRPPIGLVVAEASVRQLAASVGRPSATLAVGLDLRADHAHLYRSGWATFKRLTCELNAAMPTGIGVCEDCRWVFHTRRKAAAFKCPRCHKRSTPTQRKPWHLHVADEETFDAATGQPSGFERRRYLTRCVGCGEPFWADRRDRKACSPRCRVRAHRAAARTR